MLRRALPLIFVGALGLTACGGSGGSSTPAAPSVLATAPEPGTAPPPTVTPAGRVLELHASGAEGVVVDGASRYAVVATRAPGRLQVVDLRTFAVTGQITPPGAARHLQLAGPEEVIVPAENTNTVSVLHIPDGRLISEVHTKRQPHDAAILPDGVIVTAVELGNAATASRGNMVLGTINGIIQPGGVAVANGLAAMTEVRGRLLDVFTGDPFRKIARLAVGKGPTHDIGLGNGTVAVADTLGNQVLVVAISAHPTVVASVPCPGRPYGLAVDLTRHRLWVTSSGTNVIHEYVIGKPGSTPTQVRTFPTVRQPNSAAVVPSTGQVIVAGSTRTDATLQEITP